MIHIEKPYIKQEGDRCYLRAKVSISIDTARSYVEAITPQKHNTVFLTDEDYPPESWKKNGELWFDVPAEYGRYLCSERSNAFVVGLFWYALVSGSDIEFEAPMSKLLYDGIVHELMPELEKKGFAPIALKGPVTSEQVWCEGAVVTGMSGGVDSFYTLKSYSSDDVPEEMRITHLSYYTCSFLYKPDDVGRSLEAVFKDEDDTTDIIVQRIKTIAAQKGYPLIITNSNLDRDYYRGGYIYMAMYRFFACTLALEHLYSLYISSSSGHETGMIEASLFAPTQNYEELLCRSLRTETLGYMSSDNERRTEKLRSIADDPVFGKHATVCFDTGWKGKNCGVCYGCLKTIIPLDMLGLLDGFEESFNIGEYRRDREHLFRFLIEFSKRPEMGSTRDTVSQLLDLANKEKSEAGDLFINIYNMPVLSIIIPAYNCEKFIAQCLDSVLAQLPEDCELIVVDDGSTDDTSRILKDYEGLRENIRIVCNEHSGASGARNKGLELARGEYVTFLDCDDCMTDGFLAKSRELFEKQAGLYIFGIERAYLSGDSDFWTVENRIYDNASEFADEYIRKRHLLVYSNCNKFYQRRIIEASKLRFDETVDFGEDRLFNYRYLTLLDEKTIITSEMIMLKYIQRDGDSMSTRHIPGYFQMVYRLHKIKMQCFFDLSKDVTEDERLDFEAYDISREIEKTIDRFEAHPEERAENLPDINQLIFEGPYDENTKIDVLIILGSRNCGYKVDAALGIGRKNPGVKYIVSGANLHCSEVCSEAEYMADRLKESGVEESDIYIENRAQYTRQNLEYSAIILHELLKNGTLTAAAGTDGETSEKRKLRVGVLTGGFHIPRTRLISEQMSRLKDFELIWLPAYGPSTQKETWFENRAGREIVLSEYRKTLKLRKEKV